jgi:hypothetical protein
LGPDTLGRSVVFGFHFIAEWRQMKAFLPHLAKVSVRPKTRADGIGCNRPATLAQAILQIRPF